MTAPLFGLLLSGGASRRMGRDKAAIAYRGEAQLARAFALLDAACEKTFLSMRAEQDDALRARFPAILDRYDAIGPAAGILSAQDTHPGVAWLVVACDLPLLDAETLRSLIAARAPDADAVAFASRFDGLPEPLCAIWEPSSHATLRANVDGNSVCPRRTLKQLRTVLLPAPGDALDNINTPDELAQVSRRMEMQA